MTKSFSASQIPGVRTLVLAAVVIMPCWSSDAYAQFTKTWLSIGDFQHNYNEAGASPERGTDGLQWPAIYEYTDNQRSKALWIAAKNFTDEDGNLLPLKIAHIGPYGSGVGQMFPTRMEMISRFDPPKVFVDGLETFDKPINNDEVDPDMEADRMLVNELSTVTGISVKRIIRQFSQEYHDDYHVLEWIFTNTGNTDSDPEIEVEQTLDGVYFFMTRCYGMNRASHSVVGNGTAWGRTTMNDYILGNDVEDYEADFFEEDFRAQYSWLGYIPEFTRWNSIGGPALDDAPNAIPEGDSLGRLTASHFIGRGFLHVDRSATDKSDDPGQPATMNWADNDGPLFTRENDPFDVVGMQEEYDQMIATGRGQPHADLVVPRDPSLSWEERMANQTNDASLGHAGGNIPTESFGPYTLAPGDSIRIVMVDAAAGLSRAANIEIGRAYKNHHSAGNNDAPIDYDANGDGEIDPDESMSKNMWVMTSRDSLFMVFKRAIANYESDFSIPQPPLPPMEFRVTSGTDRIRLEWQPYPGESPAGGWEIYRARDRYEGAVRDKYQYELIAAFEPGVTEYDDEGVTRGISYFYYIQAVGEVNDDDTGLTPTGVPLKSSRYYTQTYNPAFLKREPGDQLSDVRVVPNPYNLTSADDVRWPDQRDQIAFLNIPGTCSIKIYTELGELIETIEHTDGSGDDFWNLTTSSNQLVVTGIYLAVIEDHETGDVVIRNFVIIR